MRKIILFVLLATFSSFGYNPTPYTKAQVEAFIREVYADQADDLVLQNDSDRLAIIEDFLARVQIKTGAEYAGKKFSLLSELSLQNKYNPELRRDAVFDPATFNPLKYRFAMMARERQVFRVDGTDYIILIHAIR